MQGVAIRVLGLSLAGSLVAVLVLFVGAGKAQAQCIANCPLEASFEVAALSDIVPGATPT